MNAKVNRHEFADRLTLGDTLAKDIAGKLDAAVKARGKASLAVSGGGTPKLMFAVLAEQEIDWSKVSITLVDERWVRESSDRSNARLVREYLLQGPAAAARFVPLHNDAPTPEAGMSPLDEALEALYWPLACAVLGMGDDGHTASFFPGGDKLEEALDPKGGLALLPMRAPNAGEPRITLTLPVLLAADALALHIEGEAKRPVLDKALSDGPESEMPVRAVLRAPRPPDIFWCP